MADIADLFFPGTATFISPTTGRPTVSLQKFQQLPISQIASAPGDADTGSLVGSIIDLVGGVIAGRSPGLPAFPPAPSGGPPLLQGPGTGRSGPGFTLGGAIPAAAMANGCPTDACCKGQHLDKATGTKCVSNRRMDVLNPQALRRAIRRAKGFERFVKSNRKSLRSLAKI